jgi:hypothetical protein
MAIFNTTITFSLPDDPGTTRLDLYESNSKDGTYSVKMTSFYDYGITDFYATELDDSKWYKIKFVNEQENTSGPLSEPVFAGTYVASAPFLVVSSFSDGANYATVQDVYDYANLTPEDISATRISAALRRARATIDFRTAEMDLERFNDFDTATARRKYNASLRMIKEAEINISLGHIYQNLSDDRIIANMRENSSAKVGSIKIGNTSIDGDDLADRNESIKFLADLADRFFKEGEKLLSSFDTNSVKLVGYDLSVRVPKFRYPFNGWV